MNDQSAFVSFLNWVNRPGQAALNLLTGRPGAAGRQLLDFLGEIPDAVLPGDVIPNATDESDNISGSDAIGLDKKEHPIAGFLADVGIGTLTDPLTYLGAPLLRGATGLAKAAIEASPAVAGAVDTTGQAVRRTFGAQRLSPEIRATVDRARAAGSNEKRAGIEKAGQALGDLSENEQNIVGDVIDNFKWQDGKLAGRLADAGDPSVVGKASIPDAVARVALHPEVTPENMGRIQQAVADVIELGKNQKARPNIFSGARGPVGEDVGLGVLASKSAGETLGGGLSDEYLMRSYSGIGADDALEYATQSVNPAKARKLNSLEDVQSFLGDNPDVTYERNALKRTAQRAEAQGTLAQRAEIGKSLVGDAFAYTDPSARSAALDKIGALAPEEQQVLKDMFTGMAPRGTLEKILATSNGLFKKAAVYGAVIPKFGSIVRNKISGIWQAAANPETRAVTGGQTSRLVSDLSDAVTQSMGLKNLSVGELTDSLNQIDAAFKVSGGAAENAMTTLTPDLADAVRYGVVDGYASAEDLLREMGQSGWQKTFHNVLNWPGRIFQGVESRMRLGAFLDLKKAGQTSEDAARAVKDSFYDYAISSKENRRARDIIPFFQFQAKAIPQTAQLIGEKPWVGVALGQVMGSQTGPIYPWMQGKTNFPLGKDTQGNDQYATGFGLPFESLGLIPTSGREIEQNIVGSSNPLLKTAYSLISGQDPYFETPYGSYDKVPAVGSAGDVGRVYNKVAGTGVIQPVDSALRTIGGLTDERHSLPVKFLDMLTGVNVASVDPNLARQKQLQDQLLRNPQVDQYRGFYQKSADPQTQELIREYKAAKDAAKQNRMSSGALL